MNAVAIETATETVAVAVRTGEGALAELALTGRRRHVETLVPALEHLLGQVGLVAGDLDVVAVDLGPGLFTGLRVGVATAKGLAEALGIGVLGFSSLEILVQAGRQAGHDEPVLAAVDARRGEVFATVAGPAGTRDLLAPGLFTPSALTQVLHGLGGTPLVAIGDGAQRYADVWCGVPGVTVAEGLGFPPPATLLALALAGDAAPVAPELIVPLYMREADAKSNFAQVDRA